MSTSGCKVFVVILFTWIQISIYIYSKLGALLSLYSISLDWSEVNGTCICIPEDLFK